MRICPWKRTRTHPKAGPCIMAKREYIQVREKPLPSIRGADGYAHTTSLPHRMIRQDAALAKFGGS